MRPPGRAHHTLRPLRSPAFPRLSPDLRPASSPPPFLPLQVREILAKAKETAFVVEHAPMEDDVKSEFVQVRQRKRLAANNEQ